MPELDKHNLLGFHADGKCECDPDSNAAPCMSCAAKEMQRDIKQLFRKGWEKGVSDFAIWSDGEQLVGCMSRPLAVVLKEGPCRTS